ncbi:MAG: serine hydrolase domain-containing protein, partial [Candidatus Kariarchaeaceae archaeon]
MTMQNIEITSEFIDKIDEFLTEEMTLQGSPGLSIGIVAGENVILTRNYGAMNLEDNKPATSDTLYMIASVTKSFTSLGILKLVEQGKLALDDEISKYLPLTLGYQEDPIRVKH